jgi:hypothetical protein
LALSWPHQNHSTSSSKQAQSCKSFNYQKLPFELIFVYAIAAIGTEAHPGFDDALIS